MLIVSARAAPPAIVGDVDEEINIGFVLFAGDILAGKKGIRVFKTYQDAEAIGIHVETRELFSRSNGILKVIGSKRFHPGERFLERNVFAEGDAVYFVISPARLSVIFP